MATAINSKKKGSRNERNLAKVFKDWTGYEFARTPGSGGLRWKRRDDVVGDITCTEQGHNFPFSIETKFYRDINFEHLVLSPKNIKLIKFWEQACSDALRAKKTPMLLVRYNGMAKTQYFAIIPKEIYLAIQDSYDLNTPALQYITTNANHQFVIMQSITLFQLDYIDVKKIARRYNKTHYPHEG